MILLTLFDHLIPDFFSSFYEWDTIKFFLNSLYWRLSPSKWSEGLETQWTVDWVYCSISQPFFLLVNSAIQLLIQKSRRHHTLLCFPALHLKGLAFLPLCWHCPCCLSHVSHWLSSSLPFSALFLKYSFKRIFDAAASCQWLPRITVFWPQATPHFSFLN